MPHKRALSNDSFRENIRTPLVDQDDLRAAYLRRKGNAFNAWLLRKPVLKFVFARLDGQRRRWPRMSWPDNQRNKRR
jgi:hypothetical protein